MPTSNLSAFFVWALASEMQFYYYNQTSFETKKKLYSSEPSAGTINRHKLFLFVKASSKCFRLTNLTIVFLLSPNQWHASMSILVTLTFTLSRILITLSSNSSLLTDWGIPCITKLFRLQYWPALFILISLFIRASFNKWTWLSSLSTRLCNDETSKL